jgi:hypothetical protein
MVEAQLESDAKPGKDFYYKMQFLGSMCIYHYEGDADQVHYTERSTRSLDHGDGGR